MSLMKLLGIASHSETARGDQIERALQSLHARGIVQSFQRMRDATFRAQWDRGNFGIELAAIQSGRYWNLAVTPICNPAGPFAGKLIGGEVLELSAWVACDKPRQLERIDRLGHVALVDRLRALEEGHPAARWLTDQFLRMAAGERLENGDLQGMVLLGARRFLKTIPGADRLHESMEPALLTLLRMNRAQRKQDTDTLEVIAGADYAAALLGFLQEAYPLEARRAVLRHAAMR